MQVFTLTSMTKIWKERIYLIPKMVWNLHFYVASLSRIQFHSRICRVEVHPVLRNPVEKCKFEIEGIKFRHIRNSRFERGCCKSDFEKWLYFPEKMLLLNVFYFCFLWHGLIRTVMIQKQLAPKASYDCGNGIMECSNME